MILKNRVLEKLSTLDFKVNCKTDWEECFLNEIESTSHNSNLKNMLIGHLKIEV